MAGAEWYYVENGTQAGPVSIEDLVGIVRRKGPESPVFGPGMADWTPARRVPEIATRLGTATSAAAPPLPPPINYASGGRAAADVIDYEIFGEEMQYVEITLDPGETVLAEAG